VPFPSKAKHTPHSRSVGGGNAPFMHHRSANPPLNTTRRRSKT